MALIDCPGCGRQTSDATRTCPHCGVALRQRSLRPVSDPPVGRSLAAIGWAIMAVGLIGAFAGFAVLGITSQSLAIFAPLAAVSILFGFAVLVLGRFLEQARPPAPKEVETVAFTQQAEPPEDAALHSAQAPGDRPAVGGRRR